MVNKKLSRLKFISLPFVLFCCFSKISLAENKLLMITAEYCVYCMIWEKEIGEIYPKTDLAKSYPLQKIEIEDLKNFQNENVRKTNITPTFIFLNDEKERGRITGYSNPEMFWWQVDEIIN